MAGKRFLFSRGQGALEYLLLIGGAVLVSTIVMILILSSTDSTQTIILNNLNIYQEALEESSGLNGGKNPGNPPATFCGDNKIQNPNEEGVDELCDGSAVTATCEDLGYVTGTPGCAADCLSYDTQDCTGGSPTYFSNQQDIQYGPFSEQVFDWYVPNPYPTQPMPVVVYSHSGGFFSGDEDVNPAVDPIPSFLSNGYAFVSVRYRLSPNPSADPGTTSQTQAIFPQQPGDVGRAIQFLRAHASEFKINPSKIIGFGRSAGAAHMLYLGFGPNLENDYSSDVVLHESSRPNVILNNVGPTDFTLYATSLPGHYFGQTTISPVLTSTLNEASAYWYTSNGANLVPTLSWYPGQEGVPPLLEVHDPYSGQWFHTLVASKGDTQSVFSNNPLDGPQLVDWIQTVI
jgi:hypothetical protein